MEPGQGVGSMELGITVGYDQQKITGVGKQTRESLVIDSHYKSTRERSGWK